MNKTEFLRLLQNELSGLPPEERQAAVKYYEEYFEEAGTEHEQDILTELGSPQEVAESILRDYSSVPVPPDKAEYNTPPRQESPKGPEQEDRYASYKAEWKSWKDRLPTWLWVVILCCAAPMLLALVAVVGSVIVGLMGGAVGLAAGLLGLLVGVVAVLFSAVLIVFLLMMSVGLAGVVMVVAGIISIVVGVVTFLAHPPASILAIGVGALVAGIGLLLALLGLWMAVWLLPKATRLTMGAIGTITNKIIGLFRKGGKVR